MVLSLGLPSFTKSSPSPSPSPSPAPKDKDQTPQVDSKKSPSSTSSSTSLAKTSYHNSSRPEAELNVTPPPPPSPPSTVSSSTLTEALRGNPFGAASHHTNSKAAAESNAIEDGRKVKRSEHEELNDALITMADLFPDIKVEVFRELLVRFDGESRLYVCVEQLLRYRDEWVRGRWNTPSADCVSSDKNDSTSTGTVGGGKEGDTELDVLVHGNRVPEDELFRSDTYKRAVKTTLSLEFRSLSRSAIEGVLAEVNFSYIRARPTLRDLSQKSWRATFGSIFPFKKKKEKDGHPLLVWQRVTDGDPTPSLKETGCAELDRELHENFLAPLLVQKREDQENGDLRMAHELNESEAKDFDALYECDCCLSDITFEQISTCSVASHIICFDCIRRTTHEALFGQGWNKSIDHEKSSLRCLAPVKEGVCEGSLDSLVVKRAILDEKAGMETYNKFETRLASEALMKSQLHLVSCPFCSYAEVDPVYHPTRKRMTWRFRRPHMITAVFIIIILLDIIPLLLLPIIAILFFNPSVPISIFSASLRNLSLKTRTQRFTCSNPSCRRQSCITCHKHWRDPHVCHEPLLLSLRTTVEAARTAAIKRTCPRCGLSFVKSSGCNKLICVCGYSMCYLCRRALGPPLQAATNNGAAVLRRRARRARGRARRNRLRNQENAPPTADAPNNGSLSDASDDESEDEGAAENVYENEEPQGYKHFCEHFRINPGSPCTECNKCDLYASENEEAVARRAGEKAEKEWHIREGLVGSSSIPGYGNVRLQLHGPSSTRTIYGLSGGLTAPWNWSWKLDSVDWADIWRFWTQDIWRDGRWMIEVQRLVDFVVENVVIVDV